MLSLEAELQIQAADERVSDSECQDTCLSRSRDVTYKRELLGSLTEAPHHPSVHA